MRRTHWLRPNDDNFRVWGQDAQGRALIQRRGPCGRWMFDNHPNLFTEDRTRVTCDHCKEAVAKVIKTERAEREAVEEYRRQSTTPFLDDYLTGTEERSPA